MMKPITLIVATVMLAGLIAACSSSDDDMAPIRFATYNAGLALGYVDYAPERQPLIGAALADLDADVVCLQEVWDQADIDALLSATQEAFPYSFYKITEDDTVDDNADAACTEEESTPLKTCVETNCGEVDPANIATCALDKCATEFGSLSPECTGCIAANLGKEVEEIFTACAAGGGGSLAYDGHNGLLLLSKLPLTQTSHFVFDSYLNRRVLLSASIEADGFDLIDVYCTHLTADLSDVNYGGDFGSWSEEQGMQIDTMLDHIADASAESFYVLMGDMNCGPETETLDSEHPENFSKFEDANLNAPYVEATDSPCSWCVENPLTGSRDDIIIDHVLFGQSADGTTFETARILDNEISFDVEGETVTSRLSDHYGVSVTAIP